MAVTVQTIPKVVKSEGRRVTIPMDDVRASLLADRKLFAGVPKGFVEIEFKLSDRDAVFVFQEQDDGLQGKR